MINKRIRASIIVAVALVMVVAMVGLTTAGTIATIGTSNGVTTIHGQGTVSGEAKQVITGTTLNAVKEVKITLNGAGKVTVKDKKSESGNDGPYSNPSGTVAVSGAKVDVTGQIKGQGTLTATAFVQSTVNMDDATPREMTVQTTVNSDVNIDVTGKGSSASAESKASGNAQASGTLEDGTQLAVQSAGSTTASGSAQSSSPSGVEAAGSIQNTAYANSDNPFGTSDNLYAVTSEVASGVTGYGTASGKASASATSSGAQITDKTGYRIANATSTGSTYASGSGSGATSTFDAVSGIYSHADNNHPGAGSVTAVTDISARSNTSGGKGTSSASASSVSNAKVYALIINPEDAHMAPESYGDASRMNASASQKGAGQVNANVQTFGINLYPGELAGTANGGPLWDWDLNVGCVTAGIAVAGADHLFFYTDEAAAQAIGTDNSFTGTGSASESVVGAVQPVIKGKPKPAPVNTLYDANAQACGIAETGAVYSAGNLLAEQPYGVLYLDMGTGDETASGTAGLLQGETEPFKFTGDALSASWVGTGAYGTSQNTKGSGKASAGNYQPASTANGGDWVTPQNEIDVSTNTRGNVSSGISFGEGPDHDPAAAAALIGSFALVDDETAIAASLLDSVAAAAGRSATANAAATGYTSGNGLYDDIVNKSDGGNITLEASSYANGATNASASAQGGLAASFGGIDSFGVALSTTHAVDGLPSYVSGDTALAHSLVTSGSVVVGTGRASGNAAGVTADPIFATEAQNIGRTIGGTLIRNLTVDATVGDYEAGVYYPAAASSQAQASRGSATAANVIGAGSFAGYNKSAGDVGTGFAETDAILLDLAIGTAFSDESAVYAHGLATGRADAGFELEGHSGTNSGVGETYAAGLVEDTVRIRPTPPPPPTNTQPTENDPIAASMIASTNIVDINSPEPTGFLYDGPGYAILDTSIIGSAAMSSGPRATATGHAAGETTAGPAEPRINLYRDDVADPFFGEYFESNSSAGGDIRTRAESGCGGVAFSHGDLLSIDFVGYDPTREDTITPLNYDKIDNHTSWLPHLDGSALPDTVTAAAPAMPTEQVGEMIKQAGDGVKLVTDSYMVPVAEQAGLPNLPEQPEGSFDAVLFHLSQSDAVALSSGNAKAEVLTGGNTQANGRLDLGEPIGSGGLVVGQENSSVGGTASAKAVSEDRGLAFSATGSNAVTFTGWNEDTAAQSVLYDKTSMNGTQLALTNGHGGAAEATGSVSGGANADNRLLFDPGSGILIQAAMASASYGIVEGYAETGDGRFCDPLATGAIVSGGLATIKPAGVWSATLDEASFILSASYAEGENGEAGNTVTGINPFGPEGAFTMTSGTNYIRGDGINRTLTSRTDATGYLQTDVDVRNGWGLSVAGAGSDNHVAAGPVVERIADDGSVLFGYAAGVGNNRGSRVTSDTILENVTTTSAGFFGSSAGVPITASNTSVGTERAENLVVIKGAGDGKSLNGISSEQEATREGARNIEAEALAGFGTELSGTGKASVWGNITNGTAYAYAIAQFPVPNPVRTEEALVNWPGINTDAVLLAGAVPPYASMDLSNMQPVQYFTGVPFQVIGDSPQVNTAVFPYFNYYWVYGEQNSDANFKPDMDWYILPQLPPV